jgi:hypothetical protein
MAQAKNKTVETTNSVKDFIKTVPDQQRQKDTLEIIRIMKEGSGFEPKMWGSGIIGFGSYHYIYESGREGDAPIIGFSPRKTEFVLYIPNFGKKEELLKKFGKHKIGKSCVYIKKVSDINIDIFKKIGC